MAHGHLKTAGVTELLLQLCLPHAGAAAVRPTGIRKDEKAPGVRKALLPFGLPPFADCLDRKTRCVEAVADADVAAICRQLVNAIGDCLAHRVLWPVMHQHGLGLSTPRPAGIPEVTDQLLFFSYPR